MGHKWLAKSEPSVYSIDDLKRDRVTFWEGVRNYQARNFLRDEWKVGDEILFYHSNAEPAGVYGIAKVKRVGVPDSTQFNKKSDYYDPKSNPSEPRWYSPEIVFVKKFRSPVTLEMIKKEKALSTMGVIKRGNRLSVQPVSDVEYKTILKLASSDE